MSMLWLSIALITLCVLLIVIYPILRRPDLRSDDRDRTEYDVALYKDQLKEIGRDLETGLISCSQAGAIRTEIQRKLLKSVDNPIIDTPDTPFNRYSRSSVYMSVAIVLFISIGAISSYSFLGSPELRDIAYTDRDIVREEAALEDWRAEQEIDALLDKLARRLEKNPGDTEGWQLLGRSLIARGRYEESVDAYKRALAIHPDNPDYSADYAEALIFANNGNVSEAASKILHKVFNFAPANPKIRYYIGLSKAQNEDFREALQDWTDIVAISPKNAPWMPTVRQQMDAVFKKSGIIRSAIKPSAEALDIAATMDLSPRPGPTADDVAAARQMSAEDQTDMIDNMVKRLAGKLESNPNDPEGWARLGRSYQTLNRYEESKKAFQNAYRQAPENMDIALAYGEVLVIIDQGYVNPTARALFEKVLSTDSENTKARFYFGMALAETKEGLPRALEIWEALLKDLPRDAPWTNSLIEQIKRVKDTIEKTAS